MGIIEAGRGNVTLVMARGGVSLSRLEAIKKAWGEKTTEEGCNVLRTDRKKKYIRSISEISEGPLFVLCYRLAPK